MNMSKRLKTREVLDLLNISRDKLRNLERDGLLVPVERTSRSKYFDKDDVEAYLKSERQILKTREVLKILNIGQDKLRNLERDGRLVPVRRDSHFKYFDKDDVETYLKSEQQRLKTREVLEILNIGEEKLRKLERDGILVPIKKNSRTKYFVKDDVMSYLNKSEFKAKNNIKMEVNVWKMRLPHSYQKFVRQLILDKQQVKNNIILLREKLRKLYPEETFHYNVTDFIYMRRVLSQLNGCSTEEMKPIIDSDPLLTIIDNDRNLSDYFLTLLDFYAKYSNHILVDIIKEVRASYVKEIKSVQSGMIKSFEMKPKKLSKLKSGSIDITSGDVMWKNKQRSQLKLLIYNKVYTKKHGSRKMVIYFPKEKVLPKGAELANVKLVLRGSGDVDALITYKTEKVPSSISRPYSLGIDPGITNHLTIASNNPDSRPLLLRSRAVNKINTLTSYANSKLGNDYRRISLNNERRRIILDNELNKLTSRIIDYCILYRIGTIYFGRNLNMKLNQKKKGKKFNKRNFAFPHYQLYRSLCHKAERSGITVVSQEESYTSKFNCMDLTNEIWKYNYKDARPTESVMKEQGLRGQRDLFTLPNSKVKINADVNGAYNIMWKGLQTVQEINLAQAARPLLIQDDFQFLDYLASSSSLGNNDSN